MPRLIVHRFVLLRPFYCPALQPHSLRLFSGHLVPRFVIRGKSHCIYRIFSGPLSLFPSEPTKWLQGDSDHFLGQFDLPSLPTFLPGPPFIFIALALVPPACIAIQINANWRHVMFLWPVGDGSSFLSSPSLSFYPKRQHSELCSRASLQHNIKWTKQ